VLVFLLWASNAFASIDPRKLAPVVRYGSGIGALGGAAFLAARGQFPLAVPLALPDWDCWVGCRAAFRVSARAPKRRRTHVAGTFRIREMELDHDSGAMRGRILAGRHRGVALDALDVVTLVDILPEIDEESRAPTCRVSGPPGAPLA